MYDYDSVSDDKTVTRDTSFLCLLYGDDLSLHSKVKDYDPSYCHTPTSHTYSCLMSPLFLVSLIILHVWHIYQLHLPCNFQTPVWFQVYTNKHLPPCNIPWAFSIWTSLIKSCPTMSLSPHHCLWHLLCLEFFPFCPEFFPFWGLVLVFVRIFLPDAKAVGWTSTKAMIYWDES